MRFLINTPDEMHEFLKKSAKEQGQPLNGLVRQILWDWVKSKTAETAKVVQLPPPSTPVARLEQPECEDAKQCALF